MARSLINISPISGAQRSSQSSYLVKLADETVYCFFVSQIDNSLYYTRTTDGHTWNDPAAIKSLGGVQSGFAVWYDKWTPGDTGTVIHLTYFDQTGDDVFYRAFDWTGETLGTEVTIFAGASTGAGANTCISITKAIGGNLYVGFDIDGGTEVGFYRSVDAGANWTSQADVNEAASTDYYYLAPGFAADTQDIICIFWDRSASEISRKLYDDSADSWAETSIAGSMTAIPASTCAPQFSITVDDANNKILLAAWSNRDTANADLRFWSIDESSITEGTNVVEDSGDDQQMCALSYNPDTGILYCFYGGKSDGSETAGTSIRIYYKTSTDLGTTWGSETQMTVGARNFDYLMTFPLFFGTGPTLDFAAMTESQTSTIDTLLYSANVFDTGGGVATPMFGGGIIQ